MGLYALYETLVCSVLSTVIAHLIENAGCVVWEM